MRLRYLIMSSMFVYVEILTGNGKSRLRELYVVLLPGSGFTRSNEVTPRSGPDEPVIREPRTSVSSE